MHVILEMIQIETTDRSCVVCFALTKVRTLYMTNKNYSKEIADYQKKIEDLQLETVKENRSSVLTVINDEIFRNVEAGCYQHCQKMEL